MERSEGESGHLESREAAEIGVFRKRRAARRELQPHEVQGRKPGRGEGKRDGRRDAVLGTVDRRRPFPLHGAVRIQDAGLDIQAGALTGAVVYDFNRVIQRIPLHMQGFAALFRAEIAGGRFEIIIVGLPHEGRPARVAHPHEHAHAMLALGLKHRAMAVVIRELSELHPLRCVRGVTVGLLDCLLQGATLLGPARREVVQAPDRAPRPLVCLRHHLLETVQADDVGHAQFAVELGRGALVEIEVDWHQVVGTTAADEPES